MRKLILTTAVALSLILVAGTAAAMSRGYYEPEGGMFVSFGFGGPVSKKTLPLQYGLLMRYDASALPFYRRLNLPPLFTLRFDANGNGVAEMAGVPFVRHVARLDQNGDNGSGDQSGGTGGFTVVDWGLLGLGLAGIGYGISKIASNKDDANQAEAQREQSMSSSGTASVATTETSGLPFTGNQPLVFGAVNPSRPSPGYSHWLNSGTGHMGDLNPR